MEPYGGLFDVATKERRFHDIENLESDPSLWNDNRRAAEILKEKKQIESVLVPMKQYVSVVSDAKTLIELCQETREVDEASLIELHQSIHTLEAGVRKMELQRMLASPLDVSDAYLEIHAGAGGTESCDWVSMLARMYQRYAESRGYVVEVVHVTDGDGAGFRSIVMEIRGLYAYGFLKAEMGVHRLVRISPFDANKRRHTSFASVYVYPSTDDEIEIEVRDEDLRIDTYRAGGAGGQHVNKTDSAVRITHLPSGIVVQCQNERSQVQNKARAMKMLKSKLYEQEEKRRLDEAAQLAGEKRSNEWGSQIRSYVMQPYQLVKDVRTAHETSDVDRVMDGEIQDFVEAYLLKS